MRNSITGNETGSIMDLTILLGVLFIGASLASSGLMVAHEKFSTDGSPSAGAAVVVGSLSSSGDIVAASTPDFNASVDRLKAQLTENGVDVSSRCTTGILATRDEHCLNAPIVGVTHQESSPGCMGAIDPNCLTLAQAAATAQCRDTVHACLVETNGQYAPLLVPATIAGVIEPEGIIDISPGGAGGGSTVSGTEL